MGSANHTNYQPLMSKQNNLQIGITGFPFFSKLRLAITMLYRPQIQNAKCCTMLLRPVNVIYLFYIIFWSNWNAPSYTQIYKQLFTKCQIRMYGNFEKTLSVT